MERKRNPGSTGPATERTAPPSIRSAAPVVALPIHRLIPPRAIAPDRTSGSGHQAADAAAIAMAADLTRRYRIKTRTPEGR
jgi:hypothetical protein